MSETNLKRQMLSGVFYTAVARYSGIVISLVVMGVLARLLTPDDFGIVAIATVFINFFQIFTNIGFSSALIQYKDLTKSQINDIYMFTVWMGVLLASLLFFSSYGIAAYYGDERLIPICQYLSLTLFFSSASIVPNSLFMRDKAFKFIAWRTFIIQVVVGLVSIIAAYLGAGLYTLLIQSVLSTSFIFLISLIRYPQHFQWTLGINSIRIIWNYSMYQFFFNVMAYFVRNLDKLLIGKYIGMIALGYYEKSYRLMSLPIQNITYVITPVLHPFLSDYQQSPEQLAYLNERIVRLLGFIGFPLSTYLYFCSREIILLFFGLQWEASIPAFQILSLNIGFQMIMTSSGSFFQSNNDTKNLFICGLFTALSTCFGFIVCICFFNFIEAFAYSMNITVFLCFLQCYWQLYRYSFHRPLQLFYRQLISPLAITILLSLSLYFIDIQCQSLDLFYSISIKTIGTLIIWFSYIYFTKENRILFKFNHNSN